MVSSTSPPASPNESVKREWSIDFENIDEERIPVAPARRIWLGQRATPNVAFTIPWKKDQQAHEGGSTPRGSLPLLKLCNGVYVREAAGFRDEAEIRNVDVDARDKLGEGLGPKQKDERKTSFSDGYGAEVDSNATKSDQIDNEHLGAEPEVTNLTKSHTSEGQEQGEVFVFGDKEALEDRPSTPHKETKDESSHIVEEQLKAFTFKDDEALQYRPSTPRITYT